MFKFLKRKMDTKNNFEMSIVHHLQKQLAAALPWLKLMKQRKEEDLLEYDLGHVLPGDEFMVNMIKESIADLTQLIEEMEK